jgi:hypothetical protein
MEGLQALTLVFGATDNQPTQWDGAPTLSGGVIERITGYHFTRQSKRRRQFMRILHASLARTASWIFCDVSSRRHDQKS